MLPKFAAYWQHLVTKEKALWKSATMWVAGIIGSLPTLLDYAQANFPQVAALIPNAFHDRAMHWIAAAVAVARLKSLVKLPTIPPAAALLLALLLPLWPAPAEAAGASTTLAWTDPSAYTDGTALPSTDIAFVTFTWTRVGSVTVIGSVQVNSGLSTVVSGLVCGTYSFTATVTTTATATYPNSTSVATNPVTYNTGIACKPNPVTGVTAT